MAQHKQVTWNELRVGLFVVAAAVLLVIVIFYVTGSAAFGAKYHLRVYLPEVDGLTVGAPVRLDGLDIGNVEKIIIAEQKAGEPQDKGRSLQLNLRVEKKFQDFIRADSTAGLITEGLLGNRYVDIDRGFVGRTLQDQEEIPGRREQALKAMMERSGALMDNLSAVTVQANAVLADVKAGRGSLGKLIEDDQIYTHLNNSLNSLDRMMADVKAGKGTLGKLVTDDAMYNQVNSIAGRLDNVLEAVQQQKGTLGKLVYDPAFHDSAQKFVDNGNGFLSDVRGGKGTLGKLITDDSLFMKYSQVGENLSNATAGLNHGDSTAGKLLTDPKLYDNLSGATGDMRLLLSEFRKDPKKFLHVKFSIF